MTSLSPVRSHHSRPATWSISAWLLPLPWPPCARLDAPFRFALDSLHLTTLPSVPSNAKASLLLPSIYEHTSHKQHKQTHKSHHILHTSNSKGKARPPITTTTTRSSTTARSCDPCKNGHCGVAPGTRNWAGLVGYRVARHRLPHGDVFAVKSVEIAHAGVLRREQSILSALASPYVVSCLGSDVSAVAADGSGGLCYNMFMEYAPGGSLADGIGRCGGRCDEALIRSIARDILRGLAYVHAAGISHCDVKARNVLIGGDGRAKIADFGCARLAADEGGGFTISQLRGTPMFMAPEAARGEEQGPAADIWALGCTVIEMAAGGSPWPRFADPVAALHHVAHSSDVPEFPPWMSEEGKDFLAKCLRRDPRERWTAEQLLAHQFVVAAPPNSVPKAGPSELWVSPKSILDQGFWEESTAGSDTTIDPTDRVRALALAGGAPVMPADWTWDELWIAVCCRAVDESASFPEFEADTDTNTDPLVRGSTSTSVLVFLAGDVLGLGAVHNHGSHFLHGFDYGDASSCNSNFCNGNSMVNDCNFVSTGNELCPSVTFCPSWPLTFFWHW